MNFLFVLNFLSVSVGLVWSPDGREIAFSTDGEGDGIFRAYRMPADGSGVPVRLIAPDSGRASAADTARAASADIVADWSSQNVIAFLRDGDIWMIPPDGGPRPFFESAATERDPTFSPDGRWLAYATEEDGREPTAVWVRPYPAGEPATMVSTRGGVGPVWSRDQRRIFFLNLPTMMAVDVETDGAFRAGTVREHLTGWTRSVCPIREYDVFPDGSIVTSLSEPEAPPRTAGVPDLQVILNFGAILEERLGRGR